MGPGPQFVHNLDMLTVPDTGAGRCLGPKENGVSLGEGGEGGPGPQGGGKDKQLLLSKGRDNMGKEKEDRANRA
jgi:hypothetical protein